MRSSVRSDVDFVITFEELWGLFDAKEIDPAAVEASSSLHDATAAGRGYAVAGGVAGAIEECLKAYYPDVTPKIIHAEGLAECKKTLALAKAGKMNGCLIEGTVENSVIGRGCIIKKGAVVKNCIVLSDAYIGENVHIENQVIDKHAKITHVKELSAPEDRPGYVRRNDTL